MNKTQYISYNGDFFKKGEAVLHYNNRAFLYGDGVFETIFAVGTQPVFPEIHFERFINGLNQIRIEAPSYFNIDFFIKEIEKLLNKNRIYKGARVRFTAFRKSGGLFSPKNNGFDFLIEANPIENEEYKLNTTGLNIEFYEDQKKEINNLSNLKTLNCLFYILAGSYKEAIHMDELIILNRNGQICEGVSSNIFIVKNNTIHTPPLSSGCLDGTMRKTVIKIAKQNHLKVIDYENISPQFAIDADEIFFTNAIKGIQWVLSYKRKRYFNFTSKKLIDMLNKAAFNLK